MRPRAEGQLERSRFVDRTIRGDRACASCGYNLRGLAVGGVCPECGRLIERSSFSDEPLSNMPREVIGRFRVGAWIGTLAAVGLIAANVMAFFGSSSIGHSLAVYGGVALLWTVAALLLTPAMHVYEATSRGFGVHGVVRRVARWGQVCWSVYFLILSLPLLIKAPLGGVARSLELAQGACAIGGLVGLVAMAILMERLAEWARDSSAQNAFHWFQWILPLAVIGLVGRGIAPGLVGPLGLTTLNLITVIGFTALLLFPLGILMLAHSISAAHVHDLEREARAEREAERRAARQAEDDARLRDVDGGNSRAMQRKRPSC